MLFFSGVLALLFAGLWIYCIIDVITTPEDACRNLPKLAWLFIVLIPDIGAIAWLIAGRPRKQVVQRPARGGLGGSAAPRRHMPTNPDDDEAFLRSLQKRVDEQRRRAREAEKRDDGSGEDPKAG